MGMGMGMGIGMGIGSTGQIARCVLEGGAARLLVALTTPAAREAARRHQAVGAAALALARGTTAGLLLSTLTKDQERITLQVIGDGPFGGLTVEASSSGQVRAYLKNPTVRRPPIGLAAPGRPPRRSSLAAGIGTHGIVNVVRDLGLREAFSGQTPLLTGEIDEDVEHYLVTSEQIDSALACDALVEESTAGSAAIIIAGGLLVQALPGTGGTAVVEAARERMRAGHLLQALADAPPSAEALARAVLGHAASGLHVLDVRAVGFHCPCSRERAVSSLMLLGNAELGAMILDDGKAEVICNFCRERYDFTEADLESIRREATGPVGPPS
jgi:molecular chaperone Hsp33